MNGITRDLKPLVRMAEQSGWELSRRGSGHIGWKPPSGPTVFTSATVSGNQQRGIRNITARLRRAGLPA